MQSVASMKLIREVAKYLPTLILLVQAASSQILELDVGTIQGSILTTRTGEPFNAFRRIPYAEPPIGTFRFAAPQPKANWSTVLDCTAYGAMCMQNDRWNGMLDLREDCLFLNVFTKNLPSDGNFELKPVIAFLHGGGFELGSSIEYGPELLMERDIVLVTIQYRLGAFGSLAVETREIPGNANFKDQNLALRWIKSHIIKFGGDASRVTLAGLSAGSHSATAHMISPMSKGLFKNVIAVSGAMPWQRNLTTNNFETAKELAALVNCPTESTTDMVRCLTDRPAVDIASNMVFPYFHCPIMSWRPVIEADYGQERFLEDEPNQLYSERKFDNVNVLVGITTDEFLDPIPAILSNTTLTSQLNENFHEVAQRCFFFEANAHKSASEIAQILRESYLSPFDKIDFRSFDGLGKLLSDGVINYGVHKFVHHISAVNDVYYYKFSYIGRFSRFLYPRNLPFGATHVDDIQYVFGASFMGSNIQLTDPENVMVQRMTRIWAQFASTGDPNNATDEYLREMHWPKHDATNEFYLDIGTHLIEKHGLFLDRFAVWEGLEMSASCTVKATLGVALTALMMLLL